MPTNPSVPPMLRLAMWSFPTIDLRGPADFLQDHVDTFQTTHSGSCRVHGSNPQPGLNLRASLVFEEEQHRGWR